MNILCVTDSSLMGGAEIQMLALFRGVADEGHAVSFLCSSERYAGEVRDAGLEARCLGAPLGKAAGLWAAAREIRRTCSVRSVDVIHAEGLRGSVAAGLARVGLDRRPALVLTVHNLANRLAPHAVAARVLRATGGFLTTVSESERQRYIGSGFPEELCRTIHNGVAPGDPVSPEKRRAARVALGVSQDGPVLAQVGRLSAEKGHTILMQALVGLGRTLPVPRLLLAGEGPLGRELERSRDRLGLQGHVTFLGFRRDVGTVLSASDILVLPSLKEVFPMVLLEGMSIGLPIVASRVGGIPELITDGIEGWLVPPGDPEALCAALRSALREEGERAERGEAGRIKARRDFTFSGMVAATVEVYRRVAEAAR